MRPPHKGLARIIRAAYHAEAHTRPGQLNALGLTLLMVAFLALAAVNVVEVLAELINPKIDLDKPDLTQVFWVWIAAFGICVTVVGVEDHYAKKHLGPRGKHRREIE